MAGAVRPLRTGPPVAQGIGLAVTVGLGTTLAVWAQRHLAEEWRAGVEASDTLVTAGPFSRIRNPFYLGCFLASGSVLAAVPSALALPHGSAFSSYKQRTGRFLPRLTT